MQVIELIDALEKMAEDAQVVLAIDTTEAEDFTIELADDGTVVLEGSGPPDVDPIQTSFDEGATEGRE